MHLSEFKYHFTINGSPSFDTDWNRLSDNDFNERPERANDLMGIEECGPVWAQDLWRVAKAVYLADRQSRRATAADKWTRTIRLSIEVNQPNLWKQQSCADLASVLQLLTGDRWVLETHSGASVAQTLFGLPEATEVALFSGGLDSTAFAAQRASRLGEHDHALFVAYEQSLKTHQEEIFRDIDDLARANPSHGTVRLRTARLSPKGKRLDSTNRSRSFLFIATAVCVAAINRVRTVTVPENGQLAINPALTLGRLSACSTRSVHPWVVEMINQVIRDIGGDVAVENPFLEHTKGDVCRLGRQSGLSWTSLHKTVSCGHPTSARAHGTAYHCGHCFPCLIRRSGLHSALAGQGDDDSGYILDLAGIDCSDPANTKAADLRDLVHWLSRDFTVDDLIADAPLPSHTSPRALMPVLLRGRDELKAMLTQLLPDQDFLDTRFPS